MKHDIRLAFIFGLLLVSASLHAKDFEVAQKDKKFSRSTLAVKVGDAVSFKNEDAFAHNIFSLSDTKTFDLGSYPSGQTKKVVFDKPGMAEIECAIHPDMTMVVEVQK